MKPPPLDVENPIEVSLIKLMQAESAPPPLTFPEVSHGLPVRGLFLSAVAHELAIVAVLFFSFALSRTHLPASRVFMVQVVQPLVCPGVRCATSVLPPRPTSSLSSSTRFT